MQFKLMYNTHIHTHNTTNIDSLKLLIIKGIIYKSEFILDPQQK